MQDDLKMNKDLVDSLKELSSSIRELNKNQNKLNIAIGLITIVQIMISAMQFIQSFAFSNNLMMIVWGIITSIAILIFVWSISQRV